MWTILFVFTLMALENAVGTIKDEQLCGVGWRHFQNACYTIQVTSKTWLESRDDCSARKSELIKLSNTEELNYVYNNFIRPLHGQSAWIGLTKIGDRFQWLDKSNLSFTNWNEGEPNNYGGKEKCVELYVDSGKWNDISCNNKRPSICKKDIIVKHPDILISTTLANVDFALKGHVIRQFHGIDVTQCATSCFDEPDCLSLNYADVKLTCELNNSTKALAQSSSFVKTQGFIYYD